MGTSYAQFCSPQFSVPCTSGDLINNLYTTGGITNISNLSSGCNGSSPSNLTYFSNMTVSQNLGASFTLCFPRTLYLFLAYSVINRRRLAE